jgi:hypothetical protein
MSRAEIGKADVGGLNIKNTMRYLPYDIIEFHV